MSKESKRDFFICSHKWCKELTERYKDINYKAQLSFCMKELLRQKRNGEHNLF